MWYRMRSLGLLTIAIACTSAGGNTSRATFLAELADSAIAATEARCDDETFSSILSEWSADIMFFVDDRACIAEYERLSSTYDGLGLEENLVYTGDPSVEDEHYAYLVYIESRGYDLPDPHAPEPLSERIAWKKEIAAKELES